MTKFNFYLGAAASAWLLAVLVIVAELFLPFKDFLKNIFSHHWIGKAVIIFGAFFIFGFFMRNKNSIGKISDGKFAWYSTLLSLAIMLLFFIVHYFIG